MPVLTNIESKEGLNQAMQTAYQEITALVKPLDQEAFLYSTEDKWSVGAQLEHLILSSKGVASALKMSKEKLAFFGKPDTEPRTYDFLFKTYKEVLSRGLKAPAQFCPDENTLPAKEELLSNWAMIEGKFLTRIPEWSEKDLDTYCLPHPAIGKLTMREMLYSTVFHTYHHLESMNALVSDK